MKSKTLLEQVTATSKDVRLLQQEVAALDLTELICEQMYRKKVSKAQLAEMLGTSPANVTQMLNGRRNMTVRTIADIMTALGMQISFKAIKIKHTVSRKDEVVNAVAPSQQNDNAVLVNDVGRNRVLTEV